MAAKRKFSSPEDAAKKVEAIRGHIARYNDPKRAFKEFEISRSTYYEYLKVLKDGGVPGLRKHMNTSISENRARKKRPITEVTELESLRLKHPSFSIERLRALLNNKVTSPWSTTNVTDHLEKKDLLQEQGIYTALVNLGEKANHSAQQRAFMNRVDPALRDSGLLPTGPGDVLVLVTFYFATVGGGYVLYMTAVIDAFSGYRFSTVHLERDEEAAHTLFDQAWKCIEARGFKATRIVLCKHGNAPLESSPLIKRIRGKGVKVECRDFAESHGGHAVALQKDMRKFRTTEGHSLRAVADFNSAWRACVDQYNKTELELYPCNGVSPETRFDLDVHSGQNRDSPLSRERVTEKPLTKIGRTVTNGKGRPRSATPVNAVAPGELTEVLRRRKAGETGPIWSRSPIGAFRPKKA